MFDPSHNPSAQGESRALARVLRLVGVGKLVLAGLTLVLAFTGYDTPKAVNIWLLLIGVNLLVLGLACLSTARSFARVAGHEPIAPELAGAMRKTARIFGYYCVLIALAVLGVGFDTVTFLGKILSR